MSRIKYYYQIDYIDERGYANYINTFTSRQRKKAIEHVNILNRANQCLNDKTYYVLDKYVRYDECDDDVLIEDNITNAKAIY